jgi:Fis family transcriptional regulator
MNAPHKKTLKKGKAAAEAQLQNKVLNECVRTSLEAYFEHLDGFKANDLYQMVMHQVEAPMLEVVLTHTQGNQSQAAELLGINRGTLRKKLKQYHLD